MKCPNCDCEIKQEEWEFPVCPKCGWEPEIEDDGCLADDFIDNEIDSQPN
jgi:Zn finger protein HypA/HybF involved in hydrogenase expression